MSETPARLGLVTGATGHVGGRVVAELIARGWRVRVFSRNAERARAATWGHAVTDDKPAGPGQVEIVEGNADDERDVARALDSVDTAWYLLHSMNGSSDFADEELTMARTFARAATRASLTRLVYLGGLHPAGDLSEHLASRVAVGQTFLECPVPTAALQAGMVVGGGSSSFRMLRHLAERLPVAVAPWWIRNRIQPIAIDDVVHYLVGAADLAEDINRTFDIGGPEDYEYADLLTEYARATGLWPRRVLTAPVTTPGLAARWVGLVTPVSATLATPLIGSLLHDTVVEERDLDDLLGPPPGGHTPLRAAIRAALDGENTRAWHHTLGRTAAAVAATAVVGAGATDPDSSWYRSLRTPDWQPSAAVFPIAWTTLYADIAVVGALSVADLADQGKHSERRRFTTALAVNLLLNAGWSILFFNRHRPRAATLESALLAASTADLVRRSARVSPEKGIVLAPYALWTGFAAVLTARIAQLDPRSGPPHARRRPRRR